MYKNQLQELAQRSCFNLPSYSCLREGPDHAPRFKATVNFNGEVFESPGYFSTLRQAEHAAAEVALNTLSKRGPVQSLAARILDETSVCKNLLQETAQRAGVSLPVYTTIRSGPKHVPVFNCVVEVGGRTFYGEPAKTKKQAEKNAAMAAWSALKQWNSSQTPLLLGSSEGNDDADRVSQNSSLSVYRREEGSGYASAMRPHGYTGRSRVTVVNVRDRNLHGRDNNSISQLYAGSSSSSDARHEQNHGIYFTRPQAAATPSLGGEMGYETGQVQGYGGGFKPYGQLHAVAPSSISGDAGLDSTGLSHSRYLFHPQSASASIAAGGGGPSARPSAQFEKRNLLSGFEASMLSREPMVGSRGSSGANMGRKMPQQQQRIRGLPLQSRSDRFEFKRLSLLEELQQRDNEDDWLRGEVSPAASQQQARRLPWQSRSERFELRRPLPELEELHRGDVEEWLQSEPSRKGSSVGQSHNYADWSLGESLGSGPHPEMSTNMYGAEWPREETTSNMASAGMSHTHGFKEDWPHIETKNDDLQVEKSLTQSKGHYGYVESWLHGELDANLQNDNSQNHSLRHCYGDDWSQEGTVTDGLQKDKGHSRGEKKSSYTSGSATSSSFSSIWSRSAQWWGSHRPSSPSSAAAAFVNTFGLRPASSMAPPVRVRHAVPVCSAPPPRCPDTSSLLPAPAAPAAQNELSVDREAATRQLLNELRL